MNKQSAERKAALWRAIASVADGSQKTFADKVGVSESAVSQWLSGDRKPDWDTAHDIAKLVGKPEMVRELRPDINWDKYGVIGGKDE